MFEEADMAEISISELINKSFDLSKVNSLTPTNSELNNQLINKNALHETARNGDLLSAEMLFENGFDINISDDIGRKPLHEAAFYGHLDVVKFLVHNGAAIDAPIYPFGHTALYLAVQKGHYDIVKFLIQYGANINVTDKLMGKSLLHIAAKKDDIKMSGILIAAGIDTLHTDTNGMTARDAAARKNNVELERILLKVMQHHAMVIEC